MPEEYIRKPTFFEKFLLIMGIVVVIIGYGLIHKLILIDNYMSWDLIISIFLWFILILLIILTAVAENVKEEMAFIVKEEVKKLQILRKK